MPAEQPDGPAAASGPATGRALHFLKDWFSRPPRPHGETIVDRRVSPLRLLYDLVYATVIAHQKTIWLRTIRAGGLSNTAVLSLTWIAWANGSLYLELHGRPEGRTRTYFFLRSAFTRHTSAGLFLATNRVGSPYDVPWWYWVLTGVVVVLAIVIRKVRR